MMKTPEVIDAAQQYVMNTYTRHPVVFVKAKGSRIWDLDGHEYLDAFPGWISNHTVSGMISCLLQQKSSISLVPISATSISANRTVLGFCLKTARFL